MMPAPDVLTYRYNGTMVYVTPAATYEVSGSHSSLHYFAHSLL